jgi:hypothetical protein
MTLVVDPVVARWRQLLSGSQLSGGTGHQRQVGEDGETVRMTNAMEACECK